MSVVTEPMFWARCDYPDCDATTSDHEVGNGIVYDSPEKLDADFAPRWEGGLDDWGWLRVDGKHYCGEHTDWDERTDERIPMAVPAPTTEETPE